jgi:hypothetical protein
VNSLRRSWRTRVGALVLAALPVGIGCSGNSGDCTLIGCVNSIYATIEDPGGRLAVEFCLDGDCSRATGRPTRREGISNGDGLVVHVNGTSLDVSFVLPGDDYSDDRTHEVTLDVQGDGEPIHVAQEIELTSSTPNGPSCGPTCWSGRLDT